MAEPEDSETSRADAEALDWIVQLQEHPEDAALRGAFESWRNASPLNAAAWVETARVYAGIGDLPPVHSGRWRQRRAGTERPPVRPARRQGRSHATRLDGRRKKLATVAIAGSAAAAVFALFILPEAALRWRADVVTGTAELREVRLDDGTVTSLAPDSAIGIDYAHGERRVTLLRGRAWFEVRHDPARPFRVIAGNVETTDLGTAFEVRMGSDDINVAVERGVVRVDDAAAAPAVSERLAAGQSLSISATGGTTRAQETADLIGSWRDGQLAVEGRPMREVVDTLRPW